MGCQYRHSGNHELSQYGSRYGAVAHARCNRCNHASRRRSATHDVPAKDDLWRVDRHDEPHRARCWFRCWCCAHEGCEERRWHILNLWHKDLHHLWRTRHGRQHHSLGACSYSRCASRNKRHLVLHCSEVPSQCRRLTRRTQRCQLCFHRAQARHQGKPHMCVVVW